MVITAYVVLTLLMWDWVPVRLVFFTFLLMLLFSWFESCKWDKENAKKAKEEKDKREYLQLLKRGKDLYIYNETWYQNLDKDVQLEKEGISSPSDSRSDSSKSKKRKRKRSKLGNKLRFYYECRCILKESEFILSFTKSQEKSVVNMKKPVKPRFHRRD